MANIDVKNELWRLAQLGDVVLIKSFVAVNFATDDRSWLGLSHNRSGDTVLHYAVRNGRLEILTWLTETHGADLELANFDGKRPLHEAAQNSHLSCVDYLVTKRISIDPLKRADWTPLMLACTKLDLDVIRKLIGAGANPKLYNKDGWNSFHIACREGSMEIVEYLLDCAPKIWNTVSNNGRTPLHTAALHGQLEVVRILLDNSGYETDTKDSCGTTPLMDALRAGHIKIAKLLIEKQKASVSAEDKMGRQALHLAAQAGCAPSVHFLLEEMCVSVNVQSPVSGVTPLHVAAKERQNKMLQLLLSCGSDVHLTDGKGRTALHIACGNQFLDSTKTLLENGSKNAKDASGNYASDLAVNKEIKTLVQSYG